MTMIGWPGSIIGSGLSTYRMASLRGVLMGNHYHLLIEKPKRPILSGACNGCRRHIRFGSTGGTI